jgi:AcrR family transcriptional regulator
LSKGPRPAAGATTDRRARRVDPRRERTRQRLIDATAEIVRAAGVGALTTVEITRRAGVHQPAFYAHFDDVGDCLAATAVGVTTRVRLLYAALHGTAIFQDAPVERVGQVLQRMYELALIERPFAELFVHNRLDRSALGVGLRGVVQDARAEVREDFRRLARQMGISRRLSANVAIVADLSVAAVLAGLEHLVDNPEANPREVAWAIARQIKGLSDGEMAELAARSRSRGRGT